MQSRDYQLMVAQFQPQFATNEDKINHAVLGLNSEAGEVASIFQKRYQGHEIDMIHVKKEMGDVMWFLSELCDAIGTSFGEIMQMNYDKLSKRFPNGFKVERSLHRAEGDI